MHNCKEFFYLFIFPFFHSLLSLRSDLFSVFAVGPDPPEGRPRAGRSTMTRRTALLLLLLSPGHGGMGAVTLAARPRFSRKAFLWLALHRLSGLRLMTIWILTTFINVVTIRNASVPCGSSRHTSASDGLQLRRGVSYTHVYERSHCDFTVAKLGNTVTLQVPASPISSKQ